MEQTNGDGPEVPVWTATTSHFPACLNSPGGRNSGSAASPMESDCSKAGIALLKGSSPQLDSHQFSEQLSQPRILLILKHKLGRPELHQPIIPPRVQCSSINPLSLKDFVFPQP